MYILFLEKLILADIIVYMFATLMDLKGYDCHCKSLTLEPIMSLIIIKDSTQF
jgi:hypothetical protein